MDEKRTFKNYTPEEIDNFLNRIINQVESMIEDNKAKTKELIAKDKKIEELTRLVSNTSRMQERLATYEKMEGTLNRAILMAQKTSDEIKSTAHKESEIIIEDAKRNASRIVNESLIKAEKAEMEAESLRRNVNIFKKRIRMIIQSQLDMVDDMDKIELENR